MTIINGNAPDANDVIESVGNVSAQLSFEQVKSDSSNWTNTDYLGADIFTADVGTKNTVDTGNSTSLYDSINDLYFLSFTDEASGDSTHDPDSFTNPSNAFDDDTGTFANKNSSGDVQLGKTFGAKYVVGAFIKADMTTVNSAFRSFILQSFNGSTWDNVETLSSFTGTSGSFEGFVLVDASVQGLRVHFDKSASPNSGDVAKLYSLEYGNSDSSSTVETNSIISDKVPDSIVVYTKDTIPANTNITVDVSDDGGSTFGITGQALNSAIDTTSFSTGNLALKFNLSSSDNSSTPKLFGYGIAITDA